VETETLLRLPEVERRTGLRRAHLYKLARTGTFPRPLKIGARASAWRASQVEAWIAARISGVA
jgi:prophage regulatory protein